MLHFFIVKDKTKIRQRQCHSFFILFIWGYISRVMCQNSNGILMGGTFSHSNCKGHVQQGIGILRRRARCSGGSSRCIKGEAGRVQIGSAGCGVALPSRPLPTLCLQAPQSTPKPGGVPDSIGSTRDSLTEMKFASGSMSSFCFLASDLHLISDFL